MTELETQLLDGFERLSRQYSEDMKRLEAQNLRLQQQVLGLSKQVSELTNAYTRLADLWNEEWKS